MNDSSVHRDVMHLLDPPIAVKFSESPVNINTEKRTLGSFQGTMTTTHAKTARTYLSPFLHRVMSVVAVCTYHAYSLWLFTLSDLKTILGPGFVFGVTNALAGAEYGLKTSGEGINRAVLQRLPLILLYVWINLLPFAISNQISSDAIKEDGINKPWRTLPSGRMTPEQAKPLMLALYLFALGLSSVAGGWKQSVTLVFIGTWYNHFAGADGSCLVRNLINALGYVCFTSGAMEVALGFPLPVETRLIEWFGVIAAVIFTTVHLQDMYDQLGDRIRGRRTVPLVIGDGSARWMTAITMIVWGYLCPRFWDSAMTVTMLSLLLAGTVAARCLMLRTIEADRLTFKLWNLWMTLVFLLPLLSQATH